MNATSARSSAGLRPRSPSSAFATIECELLDRETWPTPAAAERALFEYIEGWYNSRRRHSALDYQAPMVFERRAAPAAA